MEGSGAMFCTKCGSTIEEGKNFCTKCGASIGSKKEDAEETGLIPKKKNRKGLQIGIAAGIVTLAAGIAAILFFIIMPAINYDKAVVLANQGEYTEAIEIFARLGDYKDSQTRMESSQNWLDYEAATALFTSGDYEQAKRAFKAIVSYKDSKSMMQECQIRLDYAEALELFEQGDYLAAQDLFVQIDGYEDSNDMSYLCAYKQKYEEAVAKAGNGDYAEAMDLLKSIEKSIKNRDIDFDMDRISGDYADFKDECYVNVCYINGLDYFERGLFYSAYVEFSKADGIKQADEMAKACEQPFESGETYRNPDYAEYEVRLTFNVPIENIRNVYIKIYSGIDLVSICRIKAGEKLTIRLPVGLYSFNKAEGVAWYGDEEYFGDEGFYGRIIFGEDQRAIPEFDDTIFLVPINSYTITFNQVDPNYGAESMKRSKF
jgi:tetratricopeptide (TPR) repeat protein